MSHPSDSQKKAAVPEQQQARYSNPSAVQRFLVLSAFILPFTLVPYLVTRRRILALKRTMHETRATTIALQSRLDILKQVQVDHHNDLTSLNKMGEEIKDKLRDTISKLNERCTVFEMDLETEQANNLKITQGVVTDVEALRIRDKKFAGNIEALLKENAHQR